MKRTIWSIALGLVIMLTAYAFLYGMCTEEELTDFLGFIWAVAQLVLFVLLFKLVLALLRYTRALFKRAVLLRKIKKLANKSSYFSSIAFHVKRSIAFRLIGKYLLKFAGSQR